MSHFRFFPRLLILPLLSGLLVAGAAAAHSTGAAPPAWDQLTPAQRDQLLAPLRDRWSQADADERPEEPAQHGVARALRGPAQPGVDGSVGGRQGAAGLPQSSLLYFFVVLIFILLSNEVFIFIFN